MCHGCVLHTTLQHSIITTLVHTQPKRHGTYHYQSWDVRHVAEIIIFGGQCCTGRYVHAAHGDIVFVLILNQYGSCCLRRRGYLLIFNPWSSCCLRKCGYLLIFNPWRSCCSRWCRFHVDSRLDNYLLITAEYELHTERGKWLPTWQCNGKILNKDTKRH